MEQKADDERIIEIELERLRDFKDHPFKVMDDPQMDELTESIRHYGILTPLVVRPMPEGVYEIISGHRRKHAAQTIGYRKVPVIIRILDDEQAVISMVDFNLQREQIRPSEKACAYKMKYDAIKRTGGRTKKGQPDHPNKGKKTIQIIGKDLGDSPKQVQRYLKVSELTPDLMQMLDDGKISFNPAFELAFLKVEEQKAVAEAIRSTECAPSISQAQRIKQLSQEGCFSKEQAETILGEVKKGEVNRVTFKNEQLRKYFPRDYSAEQMKREILVILKSWMETKW